ncbi:hypothetical protein AOZ06_14115 [Kibdelosporangium phytohabitans]|uniref:Uncharacterized protein n=1 Tax=Kibdelosporangium phytohabitans TaxID=860235 RepID=A0A0N9I126_9PSEU|nr:hypothetical protein AOZ06_14115 [Kibdelosporangium phytohabitans]
MLTTIGLTVGRDTDVKFLVSPLYADDITLVIGNSVAEITFGPEAVEALRDKADDALRRLREQRECAACP